MSKKKGKNKRPGSKWVQTKRSPKNKHRWEKQVSYATRLLNRQKFFECRIKQHS